MEIYNYWLF